MLCYIKHIDSQKTILHYGTVGFHQFPFGDLLGSFLSIWENTSGSLNVYCSVLAEGANEIYFIKDAGTHSESTLPFALGTIKGGEPQVCNDRSPPKKIYPVLEIGTVPLGLVNRLSTLDDPGPYRGNRHHRRCRRSGMNACGNSANANWPKNGAGARCNCFKCTKSSCMIKRTIWYMIYVCVCVFNVFVICSILISSPPIWKSVAMKGWYLTSCCVPFMLPCAKLHTCRCVTKMERCISFDL